MPRKKASKPKKTFKIGDKVTIKDRPWSDTHAERVNIRVRGRIVGKSGNYFLVKPFKRDVNLLHGIDREEYQETYTDPKQHLYGKTMLDKGHAKETGYVHTKKYKQALRISKKKVKRGSNPTKSKKKR